MTRQAIKMGLKPLVTVLVHRFLGWNGTSSGNAAQSGHYPAMPIFQGAMHKNAMSFGGNAGMLIRNNL
jgi:hypothetical protein